MHIILLSILLDNGACFIDSGVFFPPTVPLVEARKNRASKNVLFWSNLSLYEVKVETQ